MDRFFTLKGNQIEVGDAPEVISVLPLGHVVSQKGEFDVDAESYNAMTTKIAKHGVDLVVDYEHQTLGGGQAPAAGWVKELILDGNHIKARVEWTPAARKYLENREYRYISPVITVRKSDGKAVGLHSIALTNTPAIEGMAPIVNKNIVEGGHTTMEELFKTLAGLLDLGEDATPEQIVDALKELKNAAVAKQPEDGDNAVVANKAVCEVLGLKAGATAEAIVAEITGLKRSATSNATLAEEVKALKATLAERDAAAAVEMALKAGKITPAQKEWAKSYALSSPKGFQDFVEAAPQVVPLGEVAGSTDLALKADNLSAEAMAACEQIGVSAEDIKKFGN